MVTIITVTKYFFTSSILNLLKRTYHIIYHSNLTHGITYMLYFSTPPKEDDSETNKEDQNHFQRDLQPMVSWSKQVYKVKVNHSKNQGKLNLTMCIEDKFFDIFQTMTKNP